jgi:hypothetical protein
MTRDYSMRIFEVFNKIKMSKLNKSLANMEKMRFWIERSDHNLRSDGK